MNNFRCLAFIFCLFPLYSVQECEKLNEDHGYIYDRAVDISGLHENCWIIEVPKDSFVRLQFKDYSFGDYPCSEVYVRVSVPETGETRTYCSQDNDMNTLTSLHDVSIKYYHSGGGTVYGGYTLDGGTSRTSAFHITYQLESIICITEEDHLRCSETECISNHQVCDGVKDCEDGKDEVGCERGMLKLRGMTVRSQENAVTWLKNKRSTSSGWGKNTHRAITALYLVEAHAFRRENLEEARMIKQLVTQTSVALLRNFTNPISVNQLSMFVNALTVTCHNPKKFYGYDLLQILRDRVSETEPPSPSAYLTLCNSNWTFSENDAKRLLRPLDNHSKYPFISDVQAVAVMALTCMKNKPHNFRSHTFPTNLYNSTIKTFIAGQLPDGSFGNVYTTALVTQALIASGQETNEEWNVTATAHYLMQQLNSSSIDFLSAYLTLPIFSGRSLVDITNVDCSKITRTQGEDSEISDVMNRLGDKMRVQYSLYVGDQEDVVHTIFLSMPENSSAYDLMRVAQVADPKYKFLHRNVSGQMYVYEITGITNDPEDGKFWLLYTNETGTAMHHTESPDKLILEDNGHLIMWYKTADI